LTERAKLLARLLTTRVAWPLMISIGLLCAASVVALKMSAPEKAQTQQVHIVLGSILMLATVCINYQWIGRFSFVALFGVVVLLVAVLFTNPINGSRRWFLVPGSTVQVQPSELAKMAFVLTLAWYLRHRKNNRQLLGLVGPFLIMLVPMGLILIEPDLGTALLFPPTLYAMLIAAGVRLRHLLLITLIVVCALPGLFPLLRPYQQQRIVDMIDRSKTMLAEHPDSAMDTRQAIRGSQFQQHQSEVAIGSGGMWGQGLEGGDHIRRGILPEAYTDFIFAVVGTQWGFAGCTIILLLYLAFFGASLEIAGSTKEPFGRLVVVGLSSMILFQAIINIAMTCGLCPVVGIALPFISYGGSSLIANMIAAGVLLNVSVRRTSKLTTPTFSFAASYAD
jgi:rod shape determining protein RodA